MIILHSQFSNCWCMRLFPKSETFLKSFYSIPRKKNVLTSSYWRKRSMILCKPSHWIRKVTKLSVDRSIVTHKLVIVHVCVTLAFGWATEVFLLFFLACWLCIIVHGVPYTLTEKVLFLPLILAFRGHEAGTSYAYWVIISCCRLCFCMCLWQDLISDAI